MQEDPGKQLEFPLDCQFRIICRVDANNIKNDLDAVTEKHALGKNADKGSLSKNGTFQTWILSCTIQTLESLRAVGADISAVDGVKMVL
ncbi:DUF493 family protein [Lentisphaera profundi]|uniref:DUF493 family protein n=1 Tax=Lentisphaera profundi TaxID=1658616 RepID=A0ABY7W163_9BACT|nr:DUF493 family protein [Lentisphaera profundi]WDE98771.1 DUF493 family protein [Lentisphaera profundi]